MKHGLFYLIMIFFLTTSIHANEEKNYEQKNYISILKESLEDGSVTSLRTDTGSIFYAGFSLNYITSSNIIQYDDRKTIYPLYLFVGLKAPWRISPFVEIGGDLAEIIVDNIFESEDEVNEPNTIDYYYSAGVNFHINDKFLVSIYAKKYNFLFNDYINATDTQLFKSRPASYGVGLGMQF